MGKKDQYQFGEDGEDGATATADTDTSSGPQPSVEPSEASSDPEPRQPQREQSEPDASIDIESIPFKLRREGVKDGRNSHSLYLQSETEKAIRDVRSHVEREFPDERHYKLDIYEIIMLNGLYDSDGSLDLEGITEQAKKFGYGFR